jgi:exonuclease III
MNRAALLQAISWNVDGLRAPGRTEVLEKLVADEGPDMICLQETKLQESHVKDWEGVLEGYTSHWSCSTVKKGYAGTAVFLKNSSSAPTVSFGIDDKAHDGEGRSITIE